MHRRRRRPASRERGHATYDGVDLGGARVALPARQVDRVIAAKAHRRLGPVQRYGHELVQLATPRRLVQHPVRRDGCLRPRHDHCIAGVDRRLDGLRELGAAFDQRVPPDIETSALQRPGEPDRLRLVRAGIAQEHDGNPACGIRRRSFCHRLPLRFGFSLMYRVGALCREADGAATAQRAQGCRCVTGLISNGDSVSIRTCQLEPSSSARRRPYSNWHCMNAGLK